MHFIRPKWRQRFLMGPLVALALVGADPGGAPERVILDDGTPAPRTGGSSAAAERFAHAKDDLLLALDAERVFYVDNLVFAAMVDGELTALKDIEPQIEWGTEVVVEHPSASEAGSLVVILRAPLGPDGSLCLSEVSEEQDAGLWYARVAPGAACPPRSPGMPGWSGDEGTGWGT
jgi:hypothetical protein